MKKSYDDKSKWIDPNPGTFWRRLRKDEMYLQFVIVIRDCNLIFFAVQMCFKRGDISNLMEKLVG